MYASGANRTPSVAAPRLKPRTHARRTECDAVSKTPQVSQLLQHARLQADGAGSRSIRADAEAMTHAHDDSGGLPIRQNRQLPKARHCAGARPVHCEFFYT